METGGCLKQLYVFSLANNLKVFRYFLRHFGVVKIHSRGLRKLLILGIWYKPRIFPWWEQILKVDFISSGFVPSDILYEFRIGFCAVDVFCRKELLDFFLEDLGLDLCRFWKDLFILLVSVKLQIYCYLSVPK